MSYNLKEASQNWEAVFLFFTLSYWFAFPLLLLKKYKVKISRGHVWVILKKAGFSYQKPERRYYESDPKAQGRWLKKELTRIKREAKRYKAILYFEDEASISLTPVIGKNWSRKVRTPLVSSTGRRVSLSAVSAISKSGHLIFNLKSRS